MLMKAEESCLLLIDMQEKLVPLVSDFQSLISNCQWLIALAQSLAIPTLVSEQYPKGLGPTISTLKEKLPQVQVMEKLTFSCGSDHSCLDQIKKINRSQVIIAGIEAHVCVMQTALDLIQHGQQVFIVVDAISSRNSEDKLMALQRMRSHGIQIITREMVFFEWLRTSGHPKFKELSKSFLR